MKKIFSIFLLAILLSSFLFAQERKQPRLIGGMYLHTGYIDNINRPVFGIGGKVSWRVINNLRIGSEGYSSKASINKDGSFYSIGWGGILAEYIIPIRNSNIVFGSTFGGGSNKQMEMITKGNGYNIPSVVKWDKQGGFIISPFIVYEYALSKKANLHIKADYLFSPSGFIFNKGVRIYVGFLFNMIK